MFLSSVLCSQSTAHNMENKVKAKAKNEGNKKNKTKHLQIKKTRQKTKQHKTVIV